MTGNGGSARDKESARTHFKLKDEDEEGKKKGAGDNAPMLKFNCYECKLNLQ